MTNKFSELLHSVTLVIDTSDVRKLLTRILEAATRLYLHQNVYLALEPTTKSPIQRVYVALSPGN